MLRDDREVEWGDRTGPGEQPRPGSVWWAAQGFPWWVCRTWENLQAVLSAGGRAAASDRRLGQSRSRSMWSSPLPLGRVRDGGLERDGAADQWFQALGLRREL